MDEAKNGPDRTVLMRLDKLSSLARLRRRRHCLVTTLLIAGPSLLSLRVSLSPRELTYVNLQL